MTRQSSSGNILRNWSEFDEAVFFAGLDVVKSASVFLRKRVEVWREGGKRTLAITGHGHSSSEQFNSVQQLIAASGLASVNFIFICQTFLECAKMVRLREKSQRLDEKASTRQWLTSQDSVIRSDATDTNGEDDVVSEALLFAAENLVCVLHGKLSCFSDVQIKRFRSSTNCEEWLGLGVELNKCLIVADEFSSHTFIRHVGRWISDILEKHL